MKKYPRRVYEAIRDYFYYNLEYSIDDDYVDRSLSKEDVLDYFLEWEGIGGYTNIIIAILECEEE